LLEPLEIDQTEDFRPWNLGIKVYIIVCVLKHYFS
jgi:hypothetical protein